MKTNQKTTLIATIFSVIAATANAQDVGDTSVSLGLSTFGINLEGTYHILPEWRLRGAVMGGLNYSGTEVEDGTTFDVDAGLSALALMADYYPTNSGWRVSGGLVFNGSKIDSTVTASSTDPIEIDDDTFQTGSMEIDANFKKKMSPIVTTGYDYHFQNNWILSGEIGAIYTGGIDITATSDSATLQEAIDDSVDYRDARADAAELNFWPYLSVTVGYSF